MTIDCLLLFSSWSRGQLLVLSPALLCGWLECGEVQSSYSFQYTAFVAIWSGLVENSLALTLSLDVLPSRVYDILISRLDFLKEDC